MQSLDTENFDNMLNECLTGAGITGKVSENAAIKYDNDPTYREALNSCAKSLLRDDADTFLSLHMENLRSLPDNENSRLLEAILCVEDTYGTELDHQITYRQDRYINFDAILRSFNTDVEALEYWNYLEACGGFAAPDVDPANFKLIRECVEHQHGYEVSHSHGNC